MGEDRSELQPEEGRRFFLLYYDTEDNLYLLTPHCYLLWEGILGDSCAMQLLQFEHAMVLIQIGHNTNDIF